MECAMDARDTQAPVSIDFLQIVNETIPHASSSSPETDRPQRRCLGSEATEPCPLTANPSVLLNVLSSYGLEPRDLAALEATCKFFRNPANFQPDVALPLPELAALDACLQRVMFKRMKDEDKERLKLRCGGSWKLALKYILVGEKNYRREKPQVIAGPGHSIVVTTKGDVYSFGANASGQLGLGNTEDQFKPCLISSLRGIRITQAAVGLRRTMLVSDTGSVYTFGQDIFGGLESVGTAAVNYTSSPKLVESLKDVFVVQAAIGGYFSAVLSREGQVYTFSWGRSERLGHGSDLTDVEPCLLSGPLQDALVVQIAAGNCYLLLLAYQPTGMSVYSVGCGLGGKLAHGCRTTLGTPKIVEHFQTLNVKPVSISAGAFHASALGSDGRVYTWGWNSYSCLGHGTAVEDCDCVTLPTAVEGGLTGVKAVHLSAGLYTTFVVADNGNIYSFGWSEPFNLGVNSEGEDVKTPTLSTSLGELNEKIVQISATNTPDWLSGETVSHTIALAESGKLYTFGEGTKGQLGLKLGDGCGARPAPSRVAMELI